MHKTKFLRIARDILGFILLIVAVIVFVELVRGKFFGGDSSGKDSMRGTASIQEDNESSHEVSGLSCESAIAVDMVSGKMLCDKNIHEKLYPASLTKMMTALLLSEHDDRSCILTYSERAKEEPSNKMNFRVGTRLTADNAMKAMLIFSANDVATMVAENVSGSVDRFANLMNRKAHVIGMKDTHFDNANGLPDSDHYTSAYDLSLLARRVYRIPWIIDTMETSSTRVITDSGKGTTVYNTNKTLDKNGCFAGKTGNTSEAGWCLTAFYHKNGRTILGIVMKSPSEDSLYSDMRSLIADAK